jgi:lipoprotein-releasing system permease protein
MRIIIITLMILVAAINMISALLNFILERTNLVGILKALGLANGDVRKIFFHVSLQLLIKGLLLWKYNWHWLLLAAITI